MSLNPSGKSAITILVLGDGGVGKTSLISSLVSESWSERVPPVLQPVMVPPSLMPEHIQLTIIDTSSDPAHEAEWMMHLRPTGAGAAAGGAGFAPPAPSSASKASLLADAVLLVVSADVADSFARVESHWLPLLEAQAARFQMARLPVLIAINKSAQQDASPSDSAAAASSLSASLDLDASYSSSSMRLAPFDHLVSSYRVSGVVPCSAKYLFRLSHIFYSCSQIILAPIEPLFDLHATTGTGSGGGGGGAVMRFKMLTQRALLRIFRLFDADGDGLLSFAELNHMHVVQFKGKLLAAHAFDQLMRSLANTDRDFVRLLPTPTPFTAAAATAAASSLPLSAAAALSAAVPAASVASSAPSAPVGLTFSGLLHFHLLFLQRNRHLMATWSLVHQFGYTLGQVPQHATVTPAVATAAAAASAPSSSMAVPPLARGSSLSANPATALSSSSLPSTAAPCLGSLVLSASYCKLPEPFHAGLSYELSPVAVDFLTRLFRKYDSDRDGLLCIRAPVRAAENGDAFASAVAATASPSVECDAAPSSTCNLSASSDLERIFLSSPDTPFSVPSFAQFVSRVPAAAAARADGQIGGSYIGLDGWLASWALLLYNYATTPLTLPAAAAPSGHSAASGAAAALSALAIASPTGSSSSIGGGVAPPAALAPNPDVVLRYLSYLCFPVVPASPEFSLVDAATAAAAGLHGTPVAASASALATSSKQVKVHLPRIQRCIHVTPRRGTDAEVAHNLNERILLTDPSLSASSARAQVADAAATLPRTVVCWIVGSKSCGKTSLIDCMIGNAPPNSSPLTQHVSSATVAGLNGALANSGSGSGDVPMESAAKASSSSSSSSSSASSSGVSSLHPRTYAARLPLTHQAPPSGHASASQHAEHAGIIDSSLKSASNRFLVLREIPAKLAAPLLSAPSFTAGSCDLVLLLYDGTSATSLTFLLQQLQVCYAKRVPVLVVQTKTDYANCSLAQADLHSTDFDARVEEFSARLFWDTMANPTSSPLPPCCTIFERIYHAARHPSSYVLSSVSAARRAAQRTRWIVASLLLAGGLVAGGIMAQLHGLLPSLPAPTASAAAASSASHTTITSSDKAAQLGTTHAHAPTNSG